MSEEKRRYDCLVLSGGGAKGAYGAGAAKALASYRSLKNATNPICYVGTSAGALNAAVLAAFGVDKLIEFWTESSPRRIIGFRPHHPLLRVLGKMVNPWQWLKATGRIFGWQKPFSLYRNASIRKFIAKRMSDANIESIAEHADLILAATNYSRGRMESFYVSRHIDTFKPIDEKKDVEKQRLRFFTSIREKAELIDALLASAAIPFAFPPIKIGDDWYVDGGIGNNTPVREAALFLRYLNDHTEHEVGDVYCVLQDRPGTVLDPAHTLGSIGIANRCYNLFHYTQMLPVIQSWHQINRSVVDNARRAKEFTNFLDEVGIDDTAKNTIRHEFECRFSDLQGSTTRLQMDIYEIRPAGDLGGLLDFSAAKIRDRISEGYLDAVQMLESSDKINAAEKNELLDKIWDNVSQ